MRPTESQVSSLVAAAEQGNRSAVDTLFDVLYSELHRLAKWHLRHNGGGVALGTTTLLHEVYIDISGRDSAVFPDRERFMAYASKVMRGLIIDYARSRRAQKRGGGFEITSLDDDVQDGAADKRDLSRIGAAV